MFIVNKVDIKLLVGEYAHVIKLEEGIVSLFRLIYLLTEKELEALQLYLEDALERG